MKIFRKPTQEVAKNEKVKQTYQSSGESESITIFKDRRRKGSVQDKGKAGNSSTHR